MDSNRERRQIYRTLCLLVKGLENELLTVDLRNETSVSGRLESVDSCMNMIFQDAALVEYEGSYKYFPTLFVPCRMLRDIIIPNNKPIAATIRSLVPRQPVLKPLKKKPLTFKKSRILRQQEETKLLVRNILNERKSASNADKTAESLVDDTRSNS